MGKLFLTIGSPINMVLLRLPVLHRLLSKTVLLLSYEGRRTGSRRATLAQYVQDGDTLTLFSARGRKWWPNFVHERPVQALVRRRWRPGAATVVTTDGDVMAEAFMRFYNAASPRKITLEQASRLIQRRVMIQVTLEPVKQTNEAAGEDDGQDEG